VIDRALTFLRDRVNEHVALGSGGAGTGDAIVFPDGDKLDPLALKVGATNLLLVNLEQEHVMRADDPFARATAGGEIVAMQPAIRLNLTLLFVARYRAYDAALAALGTVLRYFQANRVFESRGFPDLDPAIGRLVVEPATLPLAQQNDLWGALRLAYHPSVMFRVRLLTIEQGQGRAPLATVATPVVEVRHGVSARG